MTFYTTTAANNAAADYKHIDVAPLAGSLGAEIGGVELTSLSDEALLEIRRASDDHLVVFFRDQDLTVGDFEVFTRRWGEFGDDPFITGMAGHRNVVRLLKEPSETTGVIFGGDWHSDWSFQRTPPAYTLLYAIDVPDHGGDTLWANMYLATEWLSGTWRSVLRGLDAVHEAGRGYGPAARHNELIENMDIIWGEAGTASRLHPVLRRHPRTGREVLYVNPVYTTGLAGLRDEESAPILGQLHAVATNPVHLCRFRWRAGSLAVWDNRCTMHLPLSDYHGARREMWRTTVQGEEPVRA